MTQRLHSKILWILWHIGKVIWKYDGEKAIFPRKGEKGPDSTTFVDRKLHARIYIYIFFFRILQNW